VNKRNVFLLLRALVSVALLFLLYRRVELKDLAAVFRTVHVGPMAGVLGLMLMNTFLHAFKWTLLLRSDGIRIPFGSLLATYLVGSFFNMFLPSNIGGDAYRVYDVARYSKRGVHAFASVLADRVSGYMALVLVAVAVGLAGRRLLPDPIIVWIPVAGLAGLCALVGMALYPRPLRRLLGAPFLVKLYDARPFAAKLLESVRRYRAAPALFLKIMLVSFLFQVNVIVCIFLLARGLGLSASFLGMTVFVPFVSIMEALPISIFGLGIRDASYAYFLTHSGWPEAHALTLALAYVVLTLVYVSSGGVVFLLRPRGGRQNT
jgi:glycosyltransferase 2 family protein